MSKDLTDADDFTSPIHVPEGIDTRNDAAGDVELIAQRLANRTRNLQIHAAFRDQDNVFAGHNTFAHSIVDAITDAEEPLLVSHQSPADLGTTWRLATSFRQSVAAAGIYRYAQTYVGSNASDVEGSLLVGVNAVWDKETARWSQQYTGTDSVAVIWHRGKVRVSRVAAGTAPWASWPTIFAVGRGVGGGAGDESIINGDAYVTGTLRVTHDIMAGDDFDYLAAKSRTFPLDLATAFGDIVRQTDGSIKTGGLQVFPDTQGVVIGTGVVALPLRVSHDTVIGTIQVMVNQSAAGYPLTATLEQRSAPNWGSTPPVGPTNTVLFTATGNTNAGVKVLTIPVAANTRLDAGKEYQVVFQANTQDDRLLAVRVNNWQDIGVRNAFAGA